MLAVLALAAASELARSNGERLVSRWPAVFLLAITAAGYLTWMPLTLTMPIREVGLVFASAWFSAVILVAVLGRIAMCFIVLAIVKEREELEQRMHARTDPLTGQVAGTVSVGAAASDEIDCDLGMLFHRADGALYAAKQAGRNRVQLIGPHDPMRFDHASNVVSPKWGDRQTQHARKFGRIRMYRRPGEPLPPAAGGGAR
jgi:hypothetical protein